MKCENCKYWQDYEDRPTNVKVGLCSRVEMFWDSTDWEADEKGDYQRVVKPDCNTIAFVQDGSDYSASLLTMAHFGCVQFEPKP